MQTIKINKVKVNPNNPRIIKDSKFEKLVQSIKDLPQMLDMRPIIVDEYGYFRWEYEIQSV